MSKPILLLSYFSGIDGCCPAEWADDKVDSLSLLGYKIVLVTGLSSRYEARQNVLHYRVPSLSFVDIRTEFLQLKTTNQDIPISFYLMYPIAITLGFIFDILQRKLTHGIGGGRWSWFVPGFFVSLYACIRYRCSIILSTGGAASPHLVGILAAKLTFRRVVIELQDPLSGEDIGRNSRSALLLSIVEKILAKFSNRLVYVTEKAAAVAKLKFPNSNILAIYPGARRFQFFRSNCKNNNGPLKIVHLGTLYSSRNMNTLIAAIDRLIIEGKISSNDIEITNLGEMHGEFKEHHLSRRYIKQVPIQPRIDALKQASEFDMSLLIQHSDERSNATIPYKTYDYLNISNPIIALTNNEELSSLLIRLGHYSANVNNVDQIAELLLKILDGTINQRASRTNGIDPLVQCQKLITF